MKTELIEESVAKILNSIPLTIKIKPILIENVLLGCFFSFGYYKLSLV